MLEITSSPGATWLEATVIPKPLPGVGAYDARGAIERIRLFHHPNEQLNAFSAELARRHSLKTESNNTLPWSAS